MKLLKPRWKQTKKILDRGANLIEHDFENNPPFNEGPIRALNQVYEQYHKLLFKGKAIARGTLIAGVTVSAGAEAWLYSPEILEVLNIAYRLPEPNSEISHIVAGTAGGIGVLGYAAGRFVMHRANRMVGEVERILGQAQGGLAWAADQIGSLISGITERREGSLDYRVERLTQDIGSLVGDGVNKNPDNLTFGQLYADRLGISSGDKDANAPEEELPYRESVQPQDQGSTAPDTSLVQRLEKLEERIRQQGPEEIRVSPRIVVNPEIEVSPRIQVNPTIHVDPNIDASPTAPPGVDPSPKGSSSSTVYEPSTQEGGYRSTQSPAYQVTGPKKDSLELGFKAKEYAEQYLAQVSGTPLSAEGQSLPDKIFGIETERAFGKYLKDISLGGKKQTGEMDLSEMAHVFGAQIEHLEEDRPYYPRDFVAEFTYSLSLDKAVLELHRGNFAEANADLDRASNLNPNDAYGEIAFMRGRAYLEQDSPEQAVRHLKQAHQKAAEQGHELPNINSYLGLAHVKLAKRVLDQGNLDLAEEHYALAQAYSPDLQGV